METSAMCRLVRQVRDALLPVLPHGGAQHTHWVRCRWTLGLAGKQTKTYTEAAYKLEARLLTCKHAPPRAFFTWTNTRRRDSLRD